MKLIRQLIVFAITGAIACLLGGCEKTSQSIDQQLVPIARIKWDMLDEQKELMHLLEQNGIEVSGGGSKIYDIYVSKVQVSKALKLLETNHLVINKKLFLYEVNRQTNHK